MSDVIYNPLTAGLDEIRKSWGWFLFLGIALVMLGVACVLYDIGATFTTVYVFGWFLLTGSVFTLVHAFRTHGWNGFFLYLLSALLRGFTGYLLIRYPVAGAATLTLVVSSFLVVGGLFRAIGAAMAKFPSWGWSAFAGIISLTAGVMLLYQMPASAFWFIGFAIGVDFIFDGIAVLGFAGAIRTAPKLPAYHTA